MPADASAIASVGSTNGSVATSTRGRQSASIVRCSGGARRHDSGTNSAPIRRRRRAAQSARSRCSQVRHAIAGTTPLATSAPAVRRISSASSA
jgi:hypothetical protein